ncbi:DUF998 domain-containing protein [Lentzea sp. BCCO 10_0798]|uniref:DUF998 domain-containing protein n=1 Tax=Lentzea kristufekii TaxID=3095430 RepID=A0ABU4U1N6_9PSEU|nr:DUF998 domain-containing protein [Lentzea sp. BCCO 10_0798]MDX8054489.1 DUF998 domain-containing protein [Lentzea sp. BCCO 10_0798]
MDDYWFKPYRGTVISYNTLRRLVGIIGMALPVVLVFGSFWLLKKPIGPSISSYYHTDLRDWFVGSMWAFGVFLMAYRLGRLDNALATVAGVLAILVSLFPTASDDTAAGARPLTATLHLVCAATFFALLAVLSYLFAVPRDGYNPSPRHRRAHKTCAGVIMASLIISGAVILSTGKDVETESIWVFLLETAGILAFGVSWFMTGRPLIPEAVRTLSR